MSEEKLIATRESFGKALAELKDENIVVLDADLSSSTKRNLLQKRYDYYANLGGDKKNIKCHIYCISKMLDIYPYKSYYDKEIDKLRYFEFTKEYMQYVLDLINSIENKDIPKNLLEDEEYNLYSISNKDVHQYYNNNGNGVIISIIKF